MSSKAPLAAGLLIRLFLIQHDCGHGSFLPSKLANDWVGRAIGVLTMTPYDHWRRCHAIHHATSGNLDRRGIGDQQVRARTLRDTPVRSEPHKAGWTWRKSSSFVSASCILGRINKGG